MIATLTVDRRPILGTFTKALPGSAALNYGRSGGANCDTGCPYHPASTSAQAAPNAARCYAATCERRHDRQQLASKLARHESAGADAVTARADAECRARAYRLPWFRVSAFGSVPAEPPRGFRRLLSRLHDAGTPVHLPIETARKANRYRRHLDGLGIAVRESVATRRRWKTAPGACSIVAGSMEDRPRERVTIAKALAAERTAATGRRCIVCPAVAAMHLRTGSDRAKCGACTACADPATDVVYPVHR